MPCTATYELEVAKAEAAGVRILQARVGAAIRIGHHCGNDPTTMEEPHVSLQITLPVSIDQRLTAIQKQLGLRSKSALISLMLQEVFEGADEE